MNSKNVKLRNRFDKYITKKQKKWRSRVTVCIAAINNDVIIGTSDRMITSGDIEFEPPQPKIWPVSNSIVLMTAGDSNIQTQLCSKTYEVVGEKIKAEPTKWVSVEDTSRIYKECYNNLKNEMAKDEVLSPYILDQDTFIERQRTMNTNFIERISYKLERFEIGGVETMITGIDETGPHVFTFRNGVINCSDRIGFASIGIGSDHALSHFMLSSYTKHTSIPKALLTLHQAKKKSEVSPGVGKGTDMFIIGPDLGTFRFINKVQPDIELIDDLDTFYDEYREQIKVLDNTFEGKIADYLNEIIKSTESEQESKPSTSPAPSPEPEEDEENGEKEEE